MKEREGKANSAFVSPVYRSLNPSPATFLPKLLFGTCFLHPQAWQLSIIIPVLTLDHPSSLTLGWSRRTLITFPFLAVGSKRGAVSVGSMGSTCSTQNEAPSPAEESWRDVGSIRTPTVTFECYLPSSLSHEVNFLGILFFCVLVFCLHGCICILCIQCLWWPKKVSYPLRLELQTVGSCFVDSGNRVWVFWKGNWCS